MVEHGQPMGQRDGMSVGFTQGRLYERKEALYILAKALEAADEDLHSILQAWMVEMAESLELPMKRVVVIEDTYILI